MKQVYLITTQGNWDGDFNDVLVVSNLDKAKEIFKEVVGEAKEMYLENYDETDLTIEENDSYCEIYITGEYNYYHHIISLQSADIID